MRETSSEVVGKRRGGFDQTSALAWGLWGLLRWMLPHSSTRWQTLWGRAACLHWGQMVTLGAVRASWLLLMPFLEMDLRRLGTATTATPALLGTPNLVWKV